MSLIIRGFFAAAFLGILLWAASSYLNCHDQCAHGDKHCQERCFAKGECPMEAR